MKNKLILIFLLFINILSAQVLITEPSKEGKNIPDPSAELDVRNDTKGVYFPLVPLKNNTDTETVINPQEGTIVFNTQPHFEDAKYEGLAVWDGKEWLFSNTEEDLSKTLDVVNNKTYDGNSVIKVTDIPNSGVKNFTFEQHYDKDKWKVLLESDDINFKYDYNKGIQKIIVDAEGVAAIDNPNDSNNSFTYAVGIFVDDNLISVRKFQFETTSGLCNFQKFNIRGELIEPEIFDKIAKQAGENYHIKLAVTALPRPVGSNNYNEIAFGGNATGCSNLNSDTAKTYMNILTAEREK